MAFLESLLTDRLNRIILTQSVKVSVVAAAVVAPVHKQTKQLCCLSLSAQNQQVQCQIDISKHSENKLQCMFGADCGWPVVGECSWLKQQAKNDQHRGCDSFQTPSTTACQTWQLVAVVTCGNANLTMVVSVWCRSWLVSCWRLQFRSGEMWPHSCEKIKTEDKTPFWSFFQVRVDDRSQLVHLERLIRHWEHVFGSDFG